VKDIEVMWGTHQATCQGGVLPENRLPSSYEIPGNYTTLDPCEGLPFRVSIHTTTDADRKA